MRSWRREYPEQHRSDRRGAAVLAGVARPAGHAPEGVAVLQGVMFILLLAVCANTANLMLARASARQREMGVRLAIGAGPWRMVRLLLAESLVLAAAGTALGTVLAFWGTDALRAVPMPTACPRSFRIESSISAHCVRGRSGVRCAALSALAPAWHLSRVNPLRAIMARRQFSRPGPLRPR